MFFFCCNNCTGWKINDNTQKHDINYNVLGHTALQSARGRWKCETWNSE